MIESREDLLRLVRSAETATQADEERVREALLSAIAAGAHASLDVQLGAARSWHARLRTTLSTTSAKLAALLLGLGSLGLIALHPFGRGHEPERAHPLPTASSHAAPSITVVPRAASERSEPAAAPSAAPRSSIPSAARATATSKPVRPSAVSARPSAAPSSALDAELALLRRVQAALRDSDGARALRELDAQATAQGALAAERKAARILALCLLGRVDEASQAARAFALAYPDSPQQAAIASSCANPRRIDPR
jgi:RNA polymerase sigma-70 factor (ECF subfamily)